MRGDQFAACMQDRRFSQLFVVILKVVALLQQAWPEFDCATRGETRLATERCWGLDEQALPLGLDSEPRALVVRNND